MKRTTTNGAADPHPVLVTVTGDDAPGVAAGLFATLERLGAVVLDVEQVHIRGQLLLGVVVAHPDAAAVDEAVRRNVRPGLRATAVSMPAHHRAAPGRGIERTLVTVLAQSLDARQLAGVFATLSASGANIERIVQLGRYPVDSYELEVTGGDVSKLRRALGEAAAELELDVAVQPAGIHRRAKHLIVLDVDSTLVQGEAVDLLAAHAGRAREVSAVTGAAMRGEIEFAEALRRRVALLEGLDEGALEQVREELVLTPGARTLVRTLHHLGYATAAVSGGFTEVIGPIALGLGIGFVAANTLEVSGGRLTGRLVGPVVDRAGKAAALVRFAEEARVPMEHTVAVGDGANDIDMLAVAGLGIAFNAKPLVRQAADAALNVPYLDAILYLLGLSRREVESAGSPRS